MALPRFPYAGEGRKKRKTKRGEGRIEGEKWKIKKIK